MTPKEKAEELVHKFKKYAYYPKTDNDMLFVNELNNNAKQCALIAVNEILSDYKNYLLHENTEYKGLMYWNKVKSEIEKL
jgi:hypothetical protein